ncbi:hypothetical protein EDD85DRAFT_952847 [Armillaria nabsnona]|nr:hypothetical protein EDD85DRAFT_952847 [Armillaria nabsnona]
MIKTPQSGGVNSFAEYMAMYTTHKAHTKAKPASGANISSLCEPRKTISVSIPKRALATLSPPKKSVLSSSAFQKVEVSPVHITYSSCVSSFNWRAFNWALIYSSSHATSKGHALVKNKKANVHTNITHQTATCHAAAIKKLGNQPAPLGQAHKGVKPAAAATDTQPTTSPVAIDQPVASGSGHVKTPPHQDLVDHPVYARVFNPQINLHFHEPTSCHALEHLQWLALPPVPASLLKPTTQGNHTAIFSVQSNVDVHLLCVSHLFPVNMRRALSQARRVAFDARPTVTVATLLNPLLQSSDPAIYDGLCHVTCIEKDINVLYNVIIDCMLEHNKVLHSLIDGLGTIAACEGGTAMIDQYAEASDLIQSLIIEVGKFAGGSEAE